MTKNGINYSLISTSFLISAFLLTKQMGESILLLIFVFIFASVICIFGTFSLVETEKKLKLEEGQVIKNEYSKKGETIRYVVNSICCSILFIPSFVVGVFFTIIPKEITKVLIIIFCVIFLLDIVALLLWNFYFSKRVLPKNDELEDINKDIQS